MDPHTVMEGPDAQSLNDIQSYLVNFNKEISAGGQTYKEITAGGQTYLLATSDAAMAGLSGQTSFVVANTTDQLPVYEENGILQAVNEGLVETKSEQIELKDTKLKLEGVPHEQLEQPMIAQGEAVFTPINIAPTQQVATTEPLFTVQAGQALTNVNDIVLQHAQAESQLITVQPNQTQVVQPLVALQNQQAMMVAPAGQQQIVTIAQPEPQEEEEEELEEEEESTEQGNYQTVTIVPSEVNQCGEVSYVLIVSQNEQEQKANHEDIDMSVYDFKEENRSLEQQVMADGSTPKLLKGTPKKATQQLVSQLMCNYCNYTSPKRYLLTRHMKTHSEERPHKCHICDRGFKTVASLQNHINTHTGVRPHKCKECDSAFTTSGELVRHVRYRHTYEKPHKCPECDYASVELSKLKRHMRSHTGERPYQCPHCTYASPDTYKLKRHLRIHTGEKPYECDICHTRFTQSNSLKAHKLIHTGNKPVYQCELCPTTCGRKTDLKIHVQKLHTSEKPLQCKKCGKSFPDRYTWKIHVKTHEGEKCFKCELCPYAALSQRHLESHLLTHTGEKPFECEECDQSFRQKQLLKRHMNLYHNPDYVPPAPKEKIHECPECGKAFAHKGNLLRHRAQHDPENQEFQEALASYRAEQGDDYDEEAEEAAEEVVEEEEEEEEEQQLIVTQAVVGDGQPYQADPTGQVHLANINGQQVQLQLVNLNDENNTQVYIQIDSSQQLQNLMEQQVTDGGGHIVVADESHMVAVESHLVTEQDHMVVEDGGHMVMHVEDQGEEEEEEEEEMVQQVMEVETPTGPALTGLRTTRLEIKQEDMKQEAEGEEFELEGTPTAKRIRRDSPRSLLRGEDAHVEHVTYEGSVNTIARKELLENICTTLLS